MRRLLFAACILLSGCLAQADQQQEAQALVEKLHTAMSQQDWDAATSLYDKRFLATHPPRAWRAQLQELFAKQGKIVDIKPTFQQKDPRFGGEFYIFGYRLKCEHGTVKETITVFHPVDGDTLTITGHLLKPRTSR